MQKTVRLRCKLAVALFSGFVWVFLSAAQGAAPNYPMHPKHPQGSKQNHGKGNNLTAGYVFEEITIPGGSAVYPFDINNAGVVTGTYNDSSGKTYTFLWHKGEWTKIAKVDPQTGREEEITLVASITDSGILFGNWGSNWDSQHVGYYNPKTGEWSELPDYSDPAKPVLYGQRMNNSGVAIGGACTGADPYGYVYGCIGWIWDGQYHTVEVPSYYSGTLMSGINEHGEIVIQSDSEPVVTPFNPLRAYWLDRDGPSLIVLPETPTSLGTEYAGIYDVNNRDEAVMTAPLDDPAGYYLPLLYDYRHKTVNRLPNVPFPPCNEAGGAFYTGMNNQGGLVGVCWEVLEDFTFVQHAFVAHKN